MKQKRYGKRGTSTESPKKFEYNSIVKKIKYLFSNYTVKFKENKRSLIVIFLFIFPFIYFFRQVLTGQWFSKIVINDFIRPFYNYKIYLLDVLSHGRIPLWSPSEGAGFPFYSSPLPQPFYPLTIPMMLWYKLFGGFSIFDYQLFTILGFSIFITGLFFWLISLKTNYKYALYTALVMGLSFKVTELFRFPNALHAVAWFPWILYGIAESFKERKSYKIPLFIIIVSTIMVLTAGYPYFSYYSIFLFPIYIVLLFVKCTRKLFLGEERINAIASVKKIFFACLIGVFICLPLLIKNQSLSSVIYNRGGHDILWLSSTTTFNISDTIGSLIFPPLATAEGWYYFGMVNIFLILFYFINILLNFRKNLKDIIFFGIIFVWYLLITQLSYGAESPIFVFLWKYLPGMAYFRAWGRINILLVFIIALILPKALEYFFKFINLHNSLGMQKKITYTLFSLSVCFILIAQFIINKTTIFSNTFWGQHFRFDEIGVGQSYFLATGIISAVILFLILLFHGYLKNKINVLIVIFLIIFLFDTWPVGSAQWSINVKSKTLLARWRVPEEILTRKIYDINKADSESFFVTRKLDNVKMVERTSRFDVGIDADWYFDNYVNFLHKVYVGRENINPNLSPYYDKLLGVSQPKKLFFSTDINDTSVKDFILNSEVSEKEGEFSYRVDFYNGDKLVVAVSSKNNGYVSFIDNWDPDWRATVNGKEEYIDKLFGLFKSVKISNGKSMIVFEYKPKIFNFYE